MRSLSVQDVSAWLSITTIASAFHLVIVPPVARRRSRPSRGQSATATISVVPVVVFPVRRARVITMLLLFGLWSELLAPPPPAAASSFLQTATTSSCRCAVLYSGHVRSFAHPRVHLSHKKNLIDQLETDCEVDVFMYLSVEDEVPGRYRMGEFADELSFTPYSPQQPMVDEAVRLFKPVSIVYHQEQAGFIPNGCKARCEHNAYWQLYKMKAVYRIMEEHEALIGLPYTWVIRSRLDIGWMLPMTPLSRFPPSRVYAGHNFFPLADQFLLLPRRFASAVFGAVSLCYACDVLEAQADSAIPAQTENLFRLALRRASVPFGYYEFPVVIVRNNEGGVCGVLHPHKLTCQMLQSSGLIGPRGTAESEAPAIRCYETVNFWHRQACLEMFPPLRYGDISSPPLHHGEEPAKGGRGQGTGEEGGGRANKGVIGSVISSIHLDGDEKERYAWRGLDGGGNNAAVLGATNLVAQTFDGSRTAGGVGDGSGGDGCGGSGGGGGEKKESRRCTAADNGDRDKAAFESSANVVSFQEATGRLEGMRRKLVELGEAVRIHVDPRQDPSTFFMAHHYPFHQVNGGPRDEIAIIEGFRLSQADFNRVAIAFACLLSVDGRDEAEEIIRAEAGGAADDLRDLDRRSPRTTTGHDIGSAGGSFEGLVGTGEAKSAPRNGTGGKKSTLVLDTTAAAGGDSARALVNCSLVDPLHDVWMALLDKQFEPAEPICRGPSAPCLDRALLSELTL